MIVDTGVIYAAIERADDWHASAAELLSIAPGPLCVPALVIEVYYLLETRLSSVAERLSDLEVATTGRRHFPAV